MFCSKFLFPVYFPVFTSIAVNASVLSIVINPHILTHILRSGNFSSCMSYISKSLSLFSKIIYVINTSSSDLFFLIPTIVHSVFIICHYIFCRIRQINYHFSTIFSFIIRLSFVILCFTTCSYFLLFFHFLSKSSISCINSFSLCTADVLIIAPFSLPAM